MISMYGIAQSLSITRAPGLVWQDQQGTVHIKLWLPQTPPKRVVRAFQERLLQTIAVLVNGPFAGRSAPVAIGLLGHATKI